VALGFAQQELQRHAAFFPYASALTIAGESKMIAVDPPDGRDPLAVRAIELCFDMLGRRSNDLRACAVVADVRLPALNTDAISVTLEHVEGHAMRVLLPYL
jgi:hypothetical protein